MPTEVGTKEERDARRIEDRARDYARGIVCIAVALRLSTDVRKTYRGALKAARELAQIEAEEAGE